MAADVIESPSIENYDKGPKLRESTRKTGKVLYVCAELCF